MKHNQTLALLENRLDMFQRVVRVLALKGPKSDEPEKIAKASSMLVSECADLEQAIYTLRQDQIAEIKRERESLERMEKETP